VILLDGLQAVVAAAALAGLGFGSCWLFIGRPLRQRADDAARQADAATRQAARAERSLADETARLTAERQEHRAAAADSLRRIETLNQRLQIQQEEYERNRQAWERARLQEARRSSYLQHGAGSTVPRSDDTDDGASQLASADEVTVIRLRFSYVVERPPASVRSPGRSLVQNPTAADQIRLVIERSEVTMLRDQAQDVDDVLALGRRAHEDASWRDRFVKAASEYAGDRIGNSMFQVLTQRWRTQDVADVDTVAQALNRSDELLHDMAGKPFEQIANKVGVAPPGAAVVGGIGADLVLESISGEIQDAVRVCEVVGIGIGLATGLHPLAIACTKSLLHDELSKTLSTAINKALSTAIKDVFSDPDTITVDRAPPPSRVIPRTSSYRVTDLTDPLRVTLEEPDGLTSPPAPTIDPPDVGPSGPAIGI
jgi:hypothetical protein